MRTATPAVTRTSSCRRPLAPPIGGFGDEAMNRKPASEAALGQRAQRQLRHQPAAGSQTPPWRSQVLVVLVGLGFAVLLGRAVYVQIVATDFYLAQGEKRFVHTLELPASRGRIVDRNGLMLATSVPAPSVWANPKDLQATPRRSATLARLLGMTPAELERAARRQPERRLAAPPGRRQRRRQVKALGIKGLHEVREYKRSYPEGEAAAHVVGFTDVEDRGQEGIELAFQKDLAGPRRQRAAS